MQTDVRGLVSSRVITALAAAEGVDLHALRQPSSIRETSAPESADSPYANLLSWHGKPTAGLTSPSAAWTFFEQFELYPGIVRRAFNHPDGRLGFGLNGDEVSFELHVPRAALLMQGTPSTLTVTLAAHLPETICTALVGKPLERLIAWPPASGPDYRVDAIEAVDGLQVVRISTTPIAISAA